ncbi:DUF29 domain-containing protein [Methylobacterium haplocladii]|nr:DUF29 domain-containing protein [Methylobacterium haplocladii]GJD85813.1 hypothetical protein HPGCJGGD_3706 [Methylobacterium haplocladii]
MDRPSLYDDDIVTWAEEQAAALRALGSRAELSNAVDWENVAEEIESVGRSQVRTVESLLVQTLAHLLKRLSAPDAPARGHWRDEIATFQLSARVRYEPAMRQRLNWARIWQDAKERAEQSLRMYDDTMLPGLPPDCPLSPELLLESILDIDDALLRLAGSAIPTPSDRSQFTFDAKPKTRTTR